MTISDYREIYWAAERQKVRRTGLTGQLEDDAEILVDRMNRKRFRAGYNTNWKGLLWTREEVENYRNP